MHHYTSNLITIQSPQNENAVHIYCLSINQYWSCYGVDIGVMELTDLPQQFIWFKAFT